MQLRPNADIELALGKMKNRGITAVTTILFHKNYRKPEMIIFFSVEWGGGGWEEGRNGGALRFLLVVGGVMRHDYGVDGLMLMRTRVQVFTCPRIGRWHSAPPMTSPHL